MTYFDLKKDLLPELRRLSKTEFVRYCQSVDGRVRVGGTTGKGRLTAKRALGFLGVPTA